ncbi:carboxymuconolactone decarboxylase family protein [Dyella sedimenti]|uniref:carboxymuconolactone decarboxylase family protein n=1 Tax=Dyella sedimenti TaxID=2919947 RepID=UPI001FA9D319|nr:carboxymuconolactone decarboxylase family protein [Dyella sedimenti]
MSLYPVLTIDSAPAPSRPALQQLQAAFGFVPAIAGAMAASPPLFKGFVGLFQQVHASSLTEGQIQVLLLTNAVTNASEWAAAFHTALALKQGVPPADVEAIRHGGLPGEARLAALSALARALIEKRGHVSVPERDRFFNAGFSAEQLLEVIAVVAASTITNYTGSIARPPLEEAFQAFAWRAPAP